MTEDALQEIVNLGHELPPRVVIVTDNGPAMKSRRFRNFIQKTESLVHVRGQKYHPQRIGREERFHGSLKMERLYRVLPEERDQLVSKVKSYREFFVHERLHQSLGYLTPAQVSLKGLADGVLTHQPGETVPNSWDTTVKPVGALRLRVRFADGLSGEVVFKESHLYGVFEILRDSKLFEEVHCNNGFVEWPGDLDLAPDAM